ncbi:hypothetical protein A5881_002784 [Enterococcus termitis]|nr:hypothetical protein A5881_002552 [Enterococcus termitis]
MKTYKLICQSHKGEFSKLMLEQPSRKAAIKWAMECKAVKKVVKVQEGERIENINI